MTHHAQSMPCGFRYDMYEARECRFRFGQLATDKILGDPVAFINNGIRMYSKED